MNNQVDEVRYSKAALKFIKSRTPKEKQHLKAIIEENLKVLPPKGDIKPLQGFSDGRKRLRVGGVRIIFTYDTDGKLLVLSIIDIGNRGDVYK
jgi:mRNA interferase RelE/StbE